MSHVLSTPIQYTFKDTDSLKQQQKELKIVMSDDLMQRRSRSMKPRIGALVVKAIALAEQDWAGGLKQAADPILLGFPVHL